MSDLRVGVVVFRLAAANGGDERAESTAGGHMSIFAAADLFTFACSPFIKLASLDQALRGVVFVLDLIGETLGQFVIRHQTAGFEDKEHVAKLHDGELHVRRLSLIRT